MSHLALQTGDPPPPASPSYSYSYSSSSSPSHSSSATTIQQGQSQSQSQSHSHHVQDSPTIGRQQQVLSAGAGYYSSSSSSAATTTPNSPSSPTSGSRYYRRAAPPPSPLHNTTAISPPSSASPTKLNFAFEVHEPSTYGSVPQIVTTGPEEPRSPRDNLNAFLAAEKSYYDSDSSGAATPEEKIPGPPLSPRFPNETRSVSDPVVTKRPLGGSTIATSPTAMAGSSRMEAANGAGRTSSIDSSMSTGSLKSAQEASSPADIEKLIKAAGSPEAVIQYLLKEKHSQSQQNTQLWRLVDKQRAMILGLNKDLERALKDKEKYRKKLKEVMAVQQLPPLPTISTEKNAYISAPAKAIPRVDIDKAKEQTMDIPLSPGLDSDSQKHSPIDVSLAPYPITPPADHFAPVNGPPSAVGEMLDPSHAMPKASEHALDQYDHEAQDRAAEIARKEADAARDLPINLGLPPSRSLPSEPPRMPPPAPPMQTEESIQFLPPSAPPPRKPPPAPLQLREAKPSPTIPPDEDFDTDSDYDDILEVDEIPLEKRGRRKTREEDDREREILARKEAEMRSLSKKSKKSNSSAKGTPKEPPAEMATSEMAVSPRVIPPPMPQRDNLTASLAGMLSGDQNELRVTELQAPILSPGLPSSPRPMNLKSPVSSPPLSPRVIGMASGPLSPRPPRQPIPLPPNTPLQSPPPGEALDLKSPKPLNIIKKATDSVSAPSPTDSSRDSPIGRTQVFKGLVTEEYPNLLLPPNALPSIDIRVASSRMKPSRASLVSLTQLEEDPVFTLAIFSRADGGELWRVEKDSASLAKLDQRLKQCPAFTARTPDRSLFSGHAPAKLDARRMALDQYLDELLNTALDLPTALELCKYLSTNTLPPNADETGSSSNSINETVQKTGPGGRPFKHGYLTKRGKNFGGWKARFFVVDGPQLKYYETPGGAHLGTIKLQNAQIGKQSHHNDGSSPARPQTGNEEIDNQYRHAFLILEPKKKDPSAVTKHVLCAESDKERDQWVDTLLRWIDYRDPDDEDPKDNKAHDRHGSGNERASGANAKKKMYGQGKGQQHQPQNSDDALIGVSYEATKQGDAPQGAPSRPKTSGGFDDPPQTMSSQSGYTISAPRDPQVISDSSSWGTKMGMGGMGGLAPPPGPDEKKARKRSFFGFGPKTRTSSDGTDSLFGDGNGAASSGNVLYSGPVRQVFGAPLAEAVRFNSPVDVRVPLPAVVYRCIQYLDAKNAVFEEGIFRLSGSNVVIKQLRERFNNESDINLLTDEQYHDIHAVASLLKLYLRELPTTILTRDLHLQFLSITELSDQREKVAALSELVQRLPQANGTLLKYLIAFLIKIINNADMNKMTVRNVGIVFSPTLNIPAPVFAMFLQNYEGIFGIEPEEYELPSPVSLDESRPSIETSSQARPPTAGARESPHRQRLMEAIQDGQRTTPTPPPAAMNPLQQGYPQQLRATPTPPPQRQLSYEPQYLAQQNSAAGSHISLRPAYESGFVVPQGFDPTQLRTPTQRVVNPGYDQPLYEGGGGLQPGYDQQYGGRNNRRESAIFGMGLTPQGSRSRLRDEAQF